MTFFGQTARACSRCGTSRFWGRLCLLNRLFKLDRCFPHDPYCFFAIFNSSKGGKQLQNLKFVRQLFVLVLAITLVSLLTPGELVLAVKQWVYTWIPFAQQLDDADVTHNTDKVVHASLFACLGYLAVRGWVLRRQLAVVLVGLVWLAPQTEWVQTYIPGRGASLADVAADMAGLAVGVAWALWHQRRWGHGSGVLVGRVGRFAK